MAFGDVYNSVNTGTDSGGSRLGNAANGNIEQYTDMLPPNYGTVHNEWPLIFTMINNPIDNYVTFTYSNPSMITEQYQSCGFSPSFTPLQGLDLFIAAEGINEQFNISSFDVLYTMNATFAPTLQPTQMPTDNSAKVDDQTTTIYTVSAEETIEMNENTESKDAFNVLSDKMMMYLL
eukprot:281593_1